ncbi:hypothetical protein Tco_0564018 [Tanacetum coccineum]
MLEENKLYFKAEKEAIFLLLTGIGDEIYSTVDACNTANEIFRGIGIYKKNLAPIAKFSRALQTYQPTTFELLKLQEQDEIPLQGITTDNIAGQFRIQRTLTVGFGPLCKGMQEAKAWLRLQVSQGKDDRCAIKAETRRSLPEESCSTDRPLKRYKTMMKINDDSNVTPDSSNICNNDNQVDQNAAECVDERVALAMLCN